MFEDSTFESLGIIHTRTSGWMMATLALNGTVLLALVLLPLLFPQMLPSLVRSIPMAAPPPPVEPVPVETAPASSTFSAPQDNAPVIDMRRVIPTFPINPGIPSDPAPINLGSSDLSGNSTAASSNPFGRNTTAPIVKQGSHAPAAVSGGVMNGRLIFDPKPLYPPIARATRTAGTVVLEAVISKTGSIENLRVVSGPRMLQQAALDAVRQWRYRPYMLDGQPVEVETTVNVLFTLD
jgi:protein TonB